VKEGPRHGRYEPYVMKVREYVETHLSCEAVVISAQIESDSRDLAPDEAARPEGARVQESASAADPLDLSSARPATISPPARRKCAPGHHQPTPRRGRGVIHSDFERGFSKPRPSPTTIS